MFTHTYLALGDSYTIGEYLPVFDSFPYQTVQLLRKNGIDFYAPEIVAKTGWTTAELIEGITNTHFLPQYDFVSLLIGVNNQYRGLELNTYATEFEALLQKAIAFAGNDPKKVVVLSIPDWGVTPYAEGRDYEKIATAINTYNELNKKISNQYQVFYIDITPNSREASSDLSLMAADGLHPSGKAYAIWAKAVAGYFQQQLAP